MPFAVSTPPPSPAQSEPRTATQKGATSTDIKTSRSKTRRAPVPSAARLASRQITSPSRARSVRVGEGRDNADAADAHSVQHRRVRGKLVVFPAKPRATSKCAPPMIAITADQLMSVVNSVARNGGFIPSVNGSGLPAQEDLGVDLALGATFQPHSDQNKLAAHQTLSTRKTRGILAGVVDAFRNEKAQAALLGLMGGCAAMWAAPLAVAYLGVTGGQQLAVTGATSALAGMSAWTVINRPEATAAACLGTALGAASVVLAAPAMPMLGVVAGAAVGCFGGVGLYHFAGSLRKTVEYISWGLFGAAVILALVSTAAKPAAHAIA